MKIAVWFSCGAASAVAAKLTIEKYPTAEIRIINNPVFEEGDDNRRFLSDVEKWLRHEIELVTNPKYPNASAVEVWEKRGGMSFPRGAPCTVSLKKEARQLWELSNPMDFHVFGFTSEERGRHERFVRSERANVLPVLIDAGMTKQKCLDMIVAAGIAPPELYARGYPNANCVGCVKATSPTYWNLVRADAPDVFASRAEQSRRLKAKLVRYRGQRIYLDELPADAKGRPLKTLKAPECGSFCRPENFLREGH